MNGSPTETLGPVLSQLQHVLDCLARPTASTPQPPPEINPAVQSIESLIVDRVIEVLASQVHPREIETDLIALRELFRAEPGRFTDIPMPMRLAKCRAILGRLQATVQEAKSLTRIARSQTGHLDVDRAFMDDVDQQETSSTETSAFQVLSNKPTSGKQGGHKPLWEQPIQYAKGVGPKRAPLFEKLGLVTIEDALWYLPWRYEDRARLTSIGHLRAGEPATIAGVIRSSHARRARRRGMTILSLVVRDDTGAIEVVYFNQPYLDQVLVRDARVVMNGMVMQSQTGKTRLQMRTPHFEVMEEEGEDLLHVGRIVPIYHETKGLSSRQLRRFFKGVLDAYLPELADPLPPDLLTRHHFPELREAIKELHFPSSSQNLAILNTHTSAAHRRLAFEECVLLQLALAIRQRQHRVAHPGIAFQEVPEVETRLRSHLPYELTQAQRRVIAEIHRDMQQPYPMNRLVQGDVGSGKTVVALYAMATACGCGYQAALMAPTEILAEQHYLSMAPLLQALDMRAVLVKGGASPKERELILDEIKHGLAQVVIGTHALIQHDVEFDKLGLVVVDEQHKFGVLQRAALRGKGVHPDVLVMTATPIPRTLAMTAYGDLHVSVIDQLPPGRRPIKTILFRQSERPRAYRLVKEHIQSGRQAYVVYPLVEESEKVDLDAAIQAAKRLQAEEFSALRVGLLHGRMKSEEKVRTMAAFKDGAIDILVATTVIEVGLDVPNATVMLIEHAERFGLAQLHQLRGRVGRGHHESLCLLVSSSVRKTSGDGRLAHGETGLLLGARSTLPSPLDKKQVPVLKSSSDFSGQSAKERLHAMVNCSDGFAIAEEDLRIRGPGEFLGVRQWGVPEFRVVDLVRDGVILEQARQEAFAIIERDPELAHLEHQLLKAAMLRRWQKKFDLATVG